MIDRDDFNGIAERCYYADCMEWITGASDYCSPEHEQLDAKAMIAEGYSEVADSD